MDPAMTPAAQVIISIIPIVGITFAAIVVFFALLWHHRETKQRIANGTYIPKKFPFKAFSLLAGLLLIGIGIVLTVMFLLLEGLSWSMLGGLIPFITGLMLFAFYKLNPEFQKDSDDEE